MTQRTYFSTEYEAWEFAKMLPKTRYEVTDYGKDDSNAKEPYYIEYIDRPKYSR